MPDYPKLRDNNRASELVPGSADSLAEAIQRLRQSAETLRTHADQINEQRLNSWEGEAAEGYRNQVSRVRKWLDALDESLTRAARALEQHHEVIQHGQQQAKQAVSDYREGVRHRVENPTNPQAGAQLWVPAQQKVADAQRAHNRAAHEVIEQINQAREALPDVTSPTTGTPRDQPATTPGGQEPDPANVHQAAKDLWAQLKHNPVAQHPLRPEVAARAEPVEGS